MSLCRWLYSSCSSNIVLDITVVLLLSCHRYCHVYCPPHVSSVMSHRERSSWSSLEFSTAQNGHAPAQPARRDAVRRTQSQVSQRIGPMITPCQRCVYVRLRDPKSRRFKNYQFLFDFLSIHSPVTRYKTPVQM